MCLYFWQVVSWHDLACLLWHVLACLLFWQMVVTCLLEHFWQVLSWVADRTRQDHAKILKKKDAGLAAFEMFGLFQRTFSTPFDVFLLVHGIKLDDNHNLTTPTQHVMVGITRSKVIQRFLVFYLWRILRDLGRNCFLDNTEKKRWRALQLTCWATPDAMFQGARDDFQRGWRWMLEVSCPVHRWMVWLGWREWWKVAEFGMKRSDIKPPHATRCWVLKGLQFVITPGSCDVNVSGHLNIIEYHCKKVNSQMYASIFWCFFLQAWQTWSIPT